MSLNKPVIETGVDQLVRYLKFHPKTNINDIAKELNTTPKIIESWAEFLIEENIIGLEYHLTTPYLFYIEKNETKDINDIRRQFNQNIEEDLDNKEYNWKKYMLNLLEEHKAFFFAEAKKRRLENVEKLWEKYKEKVTTLWTQTTTN